MTAVFGAAVLVQAEPVKLRIDEARALARDAYRHGDIPLANALAKGVAKARPEDPGALVMLAATEPLLGRAEEGREAGRLAFRLSDDRATQREAAYFTSRAAAADQRFTTAQFWLRRAYQRAETDAQRDRIADAFSQVRRASPWAFRLAFSVAPNSNINGGSNSDILVIDDTLPVGRLSGAARALSGTTAALTGTVSYALSRAASHDTRLTFQGYRNYNTLSEEARDIAPRAEGSDFDYGVAELRLTHRIAKAWGPLPDRYGIAIGQTWYGGELYDRVGRLTMSRKIELGRGFTARIVGEVEHRHSDRGADDRVGQELRFDLAKELNSGNLLTASWTGTRVLSGDVNSAYDGNKLRVGYAMGEPVMGVRATGNVAWSDKDYEEFEIGFFDVEGGRQDDTISAEVNLHLERLDYMGFTPVITLSGRKSSSNISRYEGDSTGLSVGFTSSF